MDDDLNRMRTLIIEYFRMHNIDKIEDRHIYLLSTLVGYLWDDDLTKQENREETRLSVPWHSYKGTWNEIDDLIYRHGGLEWSSVDMMSQILVPGSQGYPGSTASYLIGPTLYHPGARKLIVDTNLDLPNFLEDFLPTRAAGEIWYIYIDDGNGVETPYIY
jgi:hypothetical protein